MADWNPSSILWPIAIIAWMFWTSSRRELVKEFDRNDKYAAPTSHQLRWHIRHIREDLQLVCKMLMLIAGLLAYIAFVK